MKLSKRCWLVVLLLLCCSCISLVPDAGKKFWEKSSMAEQYVEQGEALEAGGDLRNALEKYKLALTVESDFARAIERKTAVESRLQQIAHTHYLKGLAYDRAGQYDLGRKEFLAALQNWPDHRGAREKLTPGKVEEEKKYIVHTVRSGESISKLAMIYYDNYKLYHAIARFNHMEDATKIKIGQQIKVPAIENVTVAELDAKQKACQARLKASKETGPGVKDGIVRYESSIEIVKPEQTRDLSGETVSETSALESEVYEEAAVKEKTAVKGEIRREVAEELPSDVLAAEEAEVPEAPESSLGAEAEAEEKIDLKAEEFHEADGSLEDSKLASVQPSPEITIPASGQGEISKVPEPAEKSVADLPRESEIILAALMTKGKTSFEQKDYGHAIDYFEQVKAIHPEDETALEYLHKAHLQEGLNLFQKEEYLKAGDSFKQALVYNPDCESCSDYIRKSLETYKEMHYNKGIFYFGKEQLGAAIEQWRLVTAVDPGYKDVTANLKKAEMLNERLEKIKKSKKQ